MSESGGSYMYMYEEDLEEAFEFGGGEGDSGGNEWTSAGTRRSGHLDEVVGRRVDLGVGSMEAADTATVAGCGNLYLEAMAATRVSALLPESGKVVILDTLLLVKDAFRVLVQNNVRSAPLWDASKKQYVGLISVSDLIAMLRQFYRSPFAAMDELTEYTVATWRERVGRANATLTSIAPDATLLEACQIFLEQGIHRLPVVEAPTNTILGTLTHLQLLVSVFTTITIPPDFMLHSIHDLGVGKYQGIITVGIETPVIVVFNIFDERRISAVPVVDSRGVIVDIFSKADVYDMVGAQAYDDLDVTIEQAIGWRRVQRTGSVPSCSPHESLQDVVTRLLEERVHRLICVDSGGRVVGVISIADVIAFLMQAGRAPTALAASSDPAPDDSAAADATVTTTTQ